MQKLFWIIGIISTFSTSEIVYEKFQENPYVTKMRPDILKVCSGEATEFHWQLSERKKLTFSQTMVPGNWELEMVNNEPVWKLKKVGINFSLNEKNIHLNSLYPSYPKVSGVDILQVLATLSLICQKSLTLLDTSDLSETFLKLFETTWYEAKLKGISGNSNEKIKIDKTDFLDFVANKFAKENLFKEFKQILLDHEKFEHIHPVENYPMTFLWLGRFLHKTIFSTYMAKKIENPKKMRTQNFEFKITQKDLKQLLDKILPEQNDNTVKKDTKMSYKALKTNLGSFEKNHDNIPTKLGEERSIFPHETKTSEKFDTLCLTKFKNCLENIPSVEENFIYALDVYQVWMPCVSNEISEALKECAEK